MTVHARYWVLSLPCCIEPDGNGLVLMGSSATAVEARAMAADYDENAGGFGHHRVWDSQRGVDATEDDS